MTNPVDAAHDFPDPDKRFQVLAVTRGENVIFVQILDADTQTAIAMDLLSALEVAADINREAVRALEDIGRRAGAIIDPEAMTQEDERWQLAMWQRGKPSGN
jgi:hypothetical protein